MKGRSSKIFLWLAISIENNDILLTHITVVFRTVIAHFFMYYAMIKHRYLHFIKSPELNIPWWDFLHHLCHRFAWVAIFKLLQSYSCLFMQDVGNIDVFHGSVHHPIGLCHSSRTLFLTNAPETQQTTLVSCPFKGQVLLCGPSLDSCSGVSPVDDQDPQ